MQAPSTVQLARYRTVAAIALSGLAILVMTTLILARIATANISDQRVAEREEALVANGVGGWISDLEKLVVIQSTWDDALENLGQRFDPAWADENVGAYLHVSAQVQEAFVLDGRNRPIYGSAHGTGRPASTFSRLDADSAPLVARIRAREDLRKPSTGPWRTPAPNTASGIALVDGQPAILTAALVQSDFGRVRLNRPGPIIVTVQYMDAAFQRRFADRYLLENLHVHPVTNLPVLAREAAVLLRDGNGRAVARLDWRPQAPGARLLRRTLPFVLGAMALFCVVLALVFRWGSRTAQSLLASESRARHMAYHDHLTGLPNRALFFEEMNRAIARLQTGESVGLLALDLDRFKQINDLHGHNAGDELIVAIAGRLKAVAGPGRVVARLGGDEFAILCRKADRESLSSLAAQVLERLTQELDMPFGRVFPGVSVGAALVESADLTGVEGLRRADVAMYRAKEDGRGRFQFYDPAMDEVLIARRALEMDLRAALEQDELRMLYQPQIDGDGRMVGVEALVRWDHPERGPISPSYFVPIAEECGLIDQLGVFTLRRAFADSLAWPHVKVAINVSAAQLRRSDFPDRVARLAREAGVDPRRVEFEITEGILLEHNARTRQVLGRLREMGFTLALDDFGTGYSSLAYLRRYPIDKIKIDRSFITNLGVEREAEAVVAAITSLARALDLEVIAEGVETELQRLLVRRAGCSRIQGFLYAPPLEADAIADFHAPPVATRDAASRKRSVAPAGGRR